MTISNERDELADVFAGHTISFGAYPKRLMRGHAQEIATRVLSAGYRRPRTINYAEELDKLLDESLVLSEEQVWQKEPMDSEGYCWKSVTGTWELCRSDVLLPATVLWEPTP